MPEHDWVLLIIPEYAWNTWINCSDYARILIMLRYNYNNHIIIVANAIILEFLSPQFVYLGALLPFCLFLTRVRT